MPPRNKVFQGQQFPGENEDNNIIKPAQTGNTTFHGEITFDSVNGNNVQKTSNSILISEMNERSMLSVREIGRFLAGAYCAAAGSVAMSATGTDQVFGAGWTGQYNYINGNSFDAGGALIVPAGWYILSTMGYVAASGGFLTRLRTQFRRGGATYLTGGVSDFSANAAGQVTAMPFMAKQVINLPTTDALRPAYIVSISAGSVNLIVGRFLIQPLYGIG